VVFDARLPAGVKIAILPANATAPDTDVVPCFRVNVAEVIVDDLIDSLKVAAIFC